MPSNRFIICTGIGAAWIALAATVHGGGLAPQAGAGATPPPAHAPAPLTAEQIEADLALFEAAFTELHPAFADAGRRDALARFMAGVRAAARPPLTSVDLYRLLAPAAALVQDGHTSLSLPRDVSAAWTLLPLRVRVDPASRTLWALEPGMPDVPAGSRIDAVNGVRAAALIDKVGATVPRDGESTGRIAWSLSRGFRFAQATAAVLGPSDTYRVEVVRPGQRTATAVTLRGATYETLSAGVPTANAEVSLTFERDGRVAVLRIPSFTGNAGDQIAQAFATLAERRTPALVIDVRDNPGGRDVLGKALFARLATAPFPYYQSLRVLANPRHPAFAMVAAKREELPVGPDGTRQVPSPNLGQQQPDAAPFTGKVVVLVNAGTFSTAAEFASVARAASRVTLVGEETGGGRCGNNSGVVIPVPLPHSGLRLDVPIVSYTLAVPCDGSRRGVMPDEAVIPTLDDILQKRDRQLEAALKMAEQGAK